MDSDTQQPQAAKPISDDQELAKVLAGVSQNANGNLNFEETPAIIPDAKPADTITGSASVVPAPAPTMPSVPQPAVSTVPSADGNLDDIKKDALTELKPLVDKLQLAPEEMFDIYLLLLRSTDDKALIAPAHAAAKNITDETRRAQALLDIIKEIDFLSTPE